MQVGNTHGERDRSFKRRIGIGLGIFSFGIALTVLNPFSDAQAQTSAQVRVLQSDTNHIVLELDISGYDTRDLVAHGATYAALSISGLGHTGESGKPQLPIQGEMVGIPPGAQTTLRIIADDARIDSPAHPVVPAPTERIQSSPTQLLPRYVGNDIVPNAAAYASNQFYPAEPAIISSTGNWRSQRFVTVEFHPLQYNPAARQLRFHSRLQVEIAFNYPNGPTRGALGGPVNEGPFESVLREGLSNYSSATNWRANTAASPAAPKRSPAYSGGPWFRVAISTDGIYQITCTQLKSKGIDNSTLNTDTLQIFKQSTELAINIVGSSWNSACDGTDYIEFAGLGINTTYSNTNVYWLTYGSTTGKRMTSRGGSGAASVPTAFTASVHVEQDRYYSSQFPPVEGANHWFGYYLPDSNDFDKNGNNNTADYPFQTNVLATGAFTATLSVDLFGWTSLNHTTPISVNNHLIDNTTWSGTIERQATISFPQSFLTSGANTITIGEYPTGGNQDYVATHYFDLAYASAFTATNDFLSFNQPKSGTWQYQVPGFTGTSSNVRAFDLTDPFNTQIVNATVSPSTCPCTAQFTDTTSALHQYLALTTAQYKNPVITADTPPDLHANSNGADYIIISYGGFLSNIQPLADFRQSQGLRVKVLDVQSVYDEFNDGVMDPQAIRDFLSYAYANWQGPPPSYVLLVGAGTFDPKGNCGTAGYCYYNIVTSPDSTLIPPYLRMVDPWIGETDSDNRFVAFNDGSGNTLPQMAIGRLPANSAADVDAMVAKIKGNEQTPATGMWRSRISFVADNAYFGDDGIHANGDPEPAGNFWAVSDETAGDYHFNRLIADRVYFNPCDPATAPQCVLPYPAFTTPTSTETGIVNAINSGHLIVSYYGHGAFSSWASEQIFTTADISPLTNGNKYPVMLEMTCYTGYFIQPGTDSLAAVNVRAAGKGALASWAATGLGVNDGHDFLEKGFFDAVMNGGQRRIGLAAVAGKIYLWNNAGSSFRDLIDTFILVGDPASTLQLQFLPPTYLPLIRK